ncbi:hypothetical protein [Synechococcus sp. PCC 7336]|uniref:hypothetical protein n=1 Tax=Synechococcus sp. PCC 7336 TaxID=195250 RepID=UPI000347BA38|nr:hypothetical protein [Synechococcus sp. PCC 7336]
MTFFQFSAPLLRRKQTALDIQDLTGLLDIHWKIGDITVFRAMYTRIDQVFVVWGLVIAAIFATAQYLPLSWTLQAWVWSALTAIAIATTSNLAWFWVRVERLRWLVYWWAAVMLIGLLATNYSISTAWVPGLTHLCSLWLGLSALGYVVTGWGIHSRVFSIAGALHICGIFLLPLVPGWQFLFTGGVMAGCLLLLAELQWDMRPPIQLDVLTLEQQAFNRQQHQLRQMS